MRALVFTIFALLLCRGAFGVVKCFTGTGKTAAEITAGTGVDCADTGLTDCWQIVYDNAGTLNYDVGCGSTCGTATGKTTIDCATCTGSSTASCNSGAADKIIAKLKCAAGTGLASPTAATGTSAECAGKCMQQAYMDGTKKYKLACETNAAATTCPAAPAGTELSCQFCSVTDCNKASTIANLDCVTAAAGVATLPATIGSSVTSANCATKCYQQWYEISGTKKYYLGCKSASAASDCADSTATGGTQLACATCENAKDCNNAAAPIATTTTTTTTTTTATTATGGGSSNTTTTVAGGATTTGAASVLASPALLLLASVMLLLFR